MALLVHPPQTYPLLPPSTWLSSWKVIICFSNSDFNKVTSLEGRGGKVKLVNLFMKQQKADHTRGLITTKQVVSAAPGAVGVKELWNKKSSISLHRNVYPTLLIQWFWIDLLLQPSFDDSQPLLSYSFSKKCPRQWKYVNLLTVWYWH